jgi:hypothetical protein
MTVGGKMVSMLMPCVISFKVLVCSSKIEQFFFFKLRDLHRISNATEAAWEISTTLPCQLYCLLQHYIMQGRHAVLEVD